MSIWRGAQSAIFFYLSCAPCSDARYRKARARAAKHTHAERAVLRTNHPDYPDQAPPGSINPFWQAEIEAGPGINKKEWKDAKERKERERERGQKGFLLREKGEEERREGEEEEQEAHGSREAATDPRNRNASLRRTPTAYQRADEELWGSRLTSSTTAPPSYCADSHLASTSTLQLPSRPTTARTTTSSNPRAYHQDRHPAVNDLHPPTTRKITSKEEVAWMLQPLPTAAVMRGKEHPNNSSANLSRGGNGSSTGSRRSPTSLLRPPEKARLAGVNYSDDTAVGTPESPDGDEDEVLEDVDDVPEAWVYEQTRREVQARRSLEW